MVQREPAIVVCSQRRFARLPPGPISVIGDVPDEVNTMTKQECLKRAAECNRHSRSYKRSRHEALFNEACPNLDAVSRGGGRKGPSAASLLIVAPDAISAAIATAERPPQIVGRLQVLHCTIIQVKT